MVSEMKGDIIKYLKPINDTFTKIENICRNLIDSKILHSFSNSSSWLSNKCAEWIKEGIRKSVKMENYKKSGYRYKTSSMLNLSKAKVSIKNDDEEYYDEDFESKESKNINRNSEIRDYFPEVWIFKDFALNENGITNFFFYPPHSITTWIAEADFWKPSTTFICSTKNYQVLEYRKDYYIEVSTPPIVRALEAIDISVTVHSLGNESFENLYICMDKGTTNACQNRGRDGGLADNSYFSLKNNTINNMATKKFEVIFFKENINEVISFSLRKHTGDEKTFACESNDVYDIIKKSITVMPDIRIFSKSTFFIINPEKKSELNNDELVNEKNFIINEKRGEFDNVLITNITINPSKDEVVGNLMVTLSEPRMYHTFEYEIKNRKKRDALSEYSDSHIYWIMNDISSIFYKKLKNDYITEYELKENIENKIHSNIDFSKTLWPNIVKLKEYMVECDVYNYFVDTIEKAKNVKECKIKDAINGDNVWISMLNTMMICDLFTNEGYDDEKEMFFDIKKLMHFYNISMTDKLIKYISLPFEVNMEDKIFVLYGMYLHVLNSCKMYDTENIKNEIGKIYYHFENRDKEDILSTLFYVSSSKRGKDIERDFAWNDMLYCFNKIYKKMPWINENNDDCRKLFERSDKYIRNSDLSMLINLLALYAITNDFPIPTNYPNVSTSELQDYTLITRNKRNPTNLANEIFLEQESYKYIIYDMKNRNYQKKRLNITIECIPPCFSLPQDEYAPDGKSRLIHFPPQTKTILFKSKGNGKRVVLVEGNMITKMNASKNDYPLKIDVQMYSEKNDLTHMITIKNLKKQNLDMLQFEHGLYSNGYELKCDNGYVQFMDQKNIKYKTRPYRTDNSVVFLIGPLPHNKDELTYNLTQKAIEAEANDIKLVGAKIVLKHPIKGTLGKIIVDNRIGFLKNKKMKKDRDSDIEFLCLDNPKKCYCGEGTSNDVCKIKMTDRIERTLKKDLNDIKRFLIAGIVNNISIAEENEDYKKFSITITAQSCRTLFERNVHIYIRTTNSSNEKCTLISVNDEILLSGKIDNIESYQTIYHMSNEDILIKIMEDNEAMNLIGKISFVKC
uniref:A2M domain-containing protein n=1 Tax=Parastrongyloides trichosuri TaxID=131310 RepID=A0A0N4Z180_PARTI